MKTRAHGEKLKPLMKHSEREKLDPKDDLVTCAQVDFKITTDQGLLFTSCFMWLLAWRTVLAILAFYLNGLLVDNWGRNTHFLMSL